MLDSHVCRANYGASCACLVQRYVIRKVHLRMFVELQPAPDLLHNMYVCACRFRFLRLDDLESFLEDAERAAADDDDDRSQDDDADKLGDGIAAHFLPLR